MNLETFVLKNDIKQIRISNCIFHNIYPKIKNLNLKINQDYNENTLFWGMFESRDISNIGDFTGKKWIIWSAEDSNIKVKLRRYAINFIKNLKIEEHLHYDDITQTNLEKQNIISSKVIINDNINLSIKAYVNHLFQLDYFNDIKLNFYSKIKPNIVKVLLSLKEFSNNKNINYDIAILEKKDTAIITKFGLEGKLVFVNENCDFPNCIYYSNYLELIKKVYYYSINDLKKIIKSSFVKYIKSNIPDRTLVYIPIWKRHYLLERCIKSIKNQSIDVDILGVCSLYDDVKFCRKNNINYILVNNNTLGQKFQFGIEFSKLFFPKNVIIMGSDDIMSPRYVESVNNYIDEYDVVGYKTWKVYDINTKEKLKLSYDHKISEKDGIEYWGNTGNVYKHNFRSEYYGFPKKLLNESPYMIGAGRSVGYKILNKINWDVYQIFLKKYLDTNSLFKLLVIDNGNFKLLKDFDECVTSLKDYNIEMITPLKEYKNHKHIKII